MSFYEHGCNYEQKIRINLSNKATTIIKNDMDTFNITGASTIINVIIRNYCSEAKSSVIYFLEKKKEEIRETISSYNIDSNSLNEITDLLMEKEKNKVTDIIDAYKTKTINQGSNKLYHISDDNMDFLMEECREDKYYSRPSQYLKCLLEEYSDLPFIERERIIKADLYNNIDFAIKQKCILKVKAYRNKEIVQFYVKPFKILSDSMKTQEYLVCKSRINTDFEDSTIIASFNMTRMIEAKPLKSEHFSFSLEEIAEIEKELSEKGPAYLMGESKIIQIRLTDKGKKMYKNKLYSRPTIDHISPEGDYIFTCTSLQIFNYFFNFGKEAEIISPQELRKSFHSSYESAFCLYERNI